MGIQQNHNPFDTAHGQKPSLSAYGLAPAKVNESMDDVNTWLEKSADQL